MQNPWDRTYLFAEDLLNASLGMDRMPSLLRGMAQLITETQAAVTCHSAEPQPPIPFHPFHTNPAAHLLGQLPPNKTGGRQMATAW